MSEQSAKQTAMQRGDNSSSAGANASGASAPRADSQTEVAANVVAMSPPEEDSLVGTILLDRYRLISKLGIGGMGTVYLAEHITIRKKLAVKVLSSQFAHKPDLVERFLQEARAASMIDQENVVEINDFGHTPDGSVFFVMEFLSGEDLSHTIERNGAMPWQRAKPIVLQICRALAKAHEAGIIHRDMKPENCFRIHRGSNPDFIKVLDFGIAKVSSGEGEATRGLTRTGMIFGTPEYMSPEQAQGSVLDHRVDVYAVGVILYELLTGQVPFTGENFMAVLTQHMFEAPQAPSEVAPEAQISPQVEAIILKALQKKADLRFSSMQEMEEAILAVDTGASPVEVVQEATSVPSLGPMEFSAQSSVHSIQPIGAAGFPGSTNLQKSRAGLFAAVAIVVATLIGGGGYFYLASMAPSQASAQRGADSDRGNEEGSPELAAQDEGATPGDDPLPEAQPTLESQTPGPVPGGEQALVGALEPKAGEDGDSQSDAAQPETVDPAQVDLFIETPGVSASIIGKEDGKVLGITGSDSPLQMPRSEKPLMVVLKADGYRPRTIELDLRQNSRFVYELQKPRLKKSRRKKNAGDRKRPRGKSSANQSNKAGKGQGPSDAPKPSGNKELRNPFD